MVCSKTIVTRNWNAGEALKIVTVNHKYQALGFQQRSDIISITINKLFLLQWFWFLVRNITENYKMQYFYYSGFVSYFEIRCDYLYAHNVKWK